jgi:hypothetical protein
MGFYFPFASYGDLEIYQPWAVVTADGRFAFTTENGRACLWAYGRFAVKVSEDDHTFLTPVPLSVRGTPARSTS